MTETAPQTVTLDVEGMTCAACQVHVEQALRDTEGVAEASVNLMTHSARVVYQPAVTKLDSLGRSSSRSRIRRFPACQAIATNTSTTTAAPDRSARSGFKAFAAIAGGVATMLLSMPLMHGPSCMACQTHSTAC